MQSSDQEKVKMLLAKVQAGDESAFEQLFDSFRPRIYTTALRITRNEWISEEILQDTFMKVWMVRETLAGISNFEGWLITIARNITLNALKKAAREKSNFQQMAQETVTLFYPDADYEMLSKEFRQILDRAVARLPAKQKATYQLIKEQNMKRNEAAAQLNVSPETVKWNLDQAMRSIRAYCMAQMKGLPLLLILYFFSRYF